MKLVYLGKLTHMMLTPDNCRIDTRELIKKVGTDAEGKEFEKNFTVFGPTKDRLAIGIEEKEIRLYSLPELKLLETFRPDYKNEEGEMVAYTGEISGINTNRGLTSYNLLGNVCKTKCLSVESLLPKHLKFDLGMTLTLR